MVRFSRKGSCPDGMVKIIRSSVKNKVETSVAAYEGVRVLYVGSPPLFSGGASAVHMLKMCQAMTKLGISVECVLPGSFSREKLFEYYGVSVPFRVTPIALTGGPARQIVHGIAAALRALKKKGNYDFALSRNLIFSWLSAGFLGIPTVYDAHHPPVNSVARAIARSFPRLKNLMGMSFNSEGLRRIYSRQGAVHQNSVVARNGVETEMFEGLPDTASLRKKLGLSPDRKIVCYCGNTYPGRGIEILVDAAAELPDAEFVIVGGTEKDNRPHGESARLRGISNFNMVGFVSQSEVSSYLAASDVLVMPYSSAVTIRGGTEAGEFTCPLKLFEYMAAAKPIVATEIPSVMEILEPGRNSVTVPPDDPRKFIDALSAVLADAELSSRISQNALSDAGLYTWEKRVERIIGELGAVVSS